MEKIIFSYWCENIDFKQFFSKTSLQEKENMIYLYTDKIRRKKEKNVIRCRRKRREINKI